MAAHAVFLLLFILAFAPASVAQTSVTSLLSPVDLLSAASDAYLGSVAFMSGRSSSGAAVNDGLVFTGGDEVGMPATSEAFFGAASIQCGTYTWVTGGTNGNVTQNQISYFNFTSNTLTPDGRLLTARTGHAVGSFEGIVYLGGGVVTDSPGEILLDSVEAFSCIPGASDAVTSPNLTLATPRKWLAAAAGPDRIVFAGGFDTEALDHVDVCTLEVCSNSLATMNTARYNHAGAYAGGYFVFAGGTDGLNPLSSVEIFFSVFDNAVSLYNGATLTLNQAGWQPTVLPVANFLVFAGGMDYLSESNAVTVLDFTGLPRKIPYSYTLSVGRGRLASGLNGTAMFFAGGSDSNGTCLSVVDILPYPIPAPPDTTPPAVVAAAVATNGGGAAAGAGAGLFAALATIGGAVVGGVTGAATAVGNAVLAGETAVVGAGASAVTGVVGAGASGVTGVASAATDVVTGVVGAGASAVTGVVGAGASVATGALSGGADLVTNVVSGGAGIATNAATLGGPLATGVVGAGASVVTGVVSAGADGATIAGGIGSTVANGVAGGGSTLANGVATVGGAVLTSGVSAGANAATAGAGALSEGITGALSTQVNALNSGGATGTGSAGGVASGPTLPTLPPTGTTAPPATTISVCIGSPPVAGAICSSGRWTTPSAKGPIVLTPGQVLMIDGSLMLDPNGVLEITIDGDSNSPKIFVNGDLTLGGQVVLELADAKDGQTIPLIVADNVNGNVSSVLVKQPDKCKKVKATPVKNGATFSAMISVQNVCTLNPWKIAAIVIACVLGTALLVAVGFVVLRRVKPGSTAFSYRSLDDEGIR